MKFEPNNSENLDVHNNFMDEDRSQFMKEEIDLPEVDIDSFDLGFDGGEEYHNAKGKIRKLFSDAGKSVSSELNKAGDNISTTTKQAIESIEAEKKKRDDKVKKALKDAADSVKASLGDAGDSIKAEGKKLKDPKYLMHIFNRFSNPVMLIIMGAINSMINANFLGISHGFWLMKDASDKGKSKQWDKILDKWYEMGGDKDKLNNRVENTKDKKPLLKKAVETIFKNKNKSGFDGSFYNAEGDVTLPEDKDGENDTGNAGKAVAGAATLLGAATGVLAVIVPAGDVPAVWTGTAAGFLGAISPLMKQFAKENGASDADVANIPDEAPEFPPQLTPEEEAAAKALAEEEDKIMGIPKTYLWISLGLLAVIVVGGIMISKGKVKS